MGKKKNIVRVLATALLALQLVFTAAEPVSAVNICAVTPEWQQHEWDCYSNDYYYSRLSEEEQAVYEKLDAACAKLLESGADADTYTVSGQKRYGTAMVEVAGLSDAAIEKIQTVFLYSNPQYFFLNNGRFLNPKKKTIALGVYDVFGSGSARRKATSQVEQKLKGLQKQVTQSEYVFETEKSIHSVICNNVRYGDDELIDKDPDDRMFYQSIYSALINGETVCAGYTKLYVALCNYYNIDCIAVNSRSHSWNMVRYGDNWYHVDVTWDENTKSEKFFHVTTRQLLAKDQRQSHVTHECLSGLMPEADVQFNPSVQTLKYLKMPDVAVNYTAAGLTINMSAATGSVYYSLDATEPGSDDIYSQPVVLNDPGTYILTAVTKKAGYADSSYLIIPIRIAPGVAAVTKAVNTAGKKIRVQYRCSEACDGYELSYASKKDFRNQKTLKVSGKPVTIQKLKKNTTYYVRVRAYKKDINGQMYYTPYSKAKKVVVTK